MSNPASREARNCSRWFLPLLLMVDAVPRHHLPNLVTNAHIVTLTRPDQGGLSLQKVRLQSPLTPSPIKGEGTLQSA